jgi:DNA-nicking Smr family endonuclease
MSGCVDPPHGQGYTKPMVKDVGLFSAAMADVKPLDGRRRAARASLAKPLSVENGPPPAKIVRAPAVGPDLGIDDRSFDRDVARALSRGKRAPEATLDLHGMTLEAAERAVGQFLERATERDFRVVLIVTGKGLREERGRLVGGRIRAEFIGWLNRADNRARVRSVRVAHPNHGGSGAFYVLLRRRSSASSRSLRGTPQR